MNRITKKMLEEQIDYLNEITGMPPAPYALGADGQYHPQAGCYHLSQSYGGVCLHQISMRQGCTGITTPLYQAHEPKRNLFNRLQAFIAGFKSPKEVQS